MTLATLLEIKTEWKLIALVKQYLSKLSIIPQQIDTPIFGLSLKTIECYDQGNLLPIA